MVNQFKSNLKPSDDVLKRIGEWISGGDVGISSRTLLSIYMGAEKGDFDAPHDSADFGRCYRLIQAIPEIKECFPVVSEHCPPFKPIIDNWDELEALYLKELYLKELPLKKLPVLYNRIKELRGLNKPSFGKWV